MIVGTCKKNGQKMEYHTHTILEWETKKWDMKERRMVGRRG
jgi:hypothetical protein